MAPLSKLSLVVPVALYDPRGPSIEREKTGQRATFSFFKSQRDLLWINISDSKNIFRIIAALELRFCSI